MLLWNRDPSIITMLSTFLCDVRQIGHVSRVRNMYADKRPLIYDNAQLKHCIGLED